MAEGGAADAMYFVQPPPEGAAGAGAAAQGVLEAWKGGALVKRYAAHEHFGELALLTGQPRAATVKAVGGPAQTRAFRHSPPPFSFVWRIPIDAARGSGE